LPPRSSGGGEPKASAATRAGWFIHEPGFRACHLLQYRLRFVGAVMRDVAHLAKAGLVLSLGLCVAGCNAFGSGQSSDAQRRGADLIIANGCGTCHSVPGIAGARGNVGPPLDHIATRVFIAGMLRNTPDNMVRWLKKSAGDHSRQCHAEHES
jgi:hypothetical protein